MDPVAHTLVGATLAESGLRRATPLATATLLLGANAPDVDIVSGFIGGSDGALYWRRGITHGVLGWIVLPLLVTGVILAWDRFVRRRRAPEAPPARAGPVLFLATLSVATHPALDWLNNYGVRLLMPFDGTWFYGDAIFIVDPWMWLLMAAAVVLARSNHKLSIAAWVVLGTAGTGLVTTADMVGWTVKGTWIAGVAAIIGLRLSRVASGHVARVAVVCLSALLLYVGANVIGTRVARRQARAWLEDRGVDTRHVMAGPIAGDPFERDVIAVTGDGYRFVRVDWLADPMFRFSHDALPRGPRDRVVEAALSAPEVRGMRNWMRFPTFQTRREPHGYTVVIRDVRYHRDDGGSFGRTEVRLDESLRPIESP